jgi:DNA-binding helix-hairpin-helix protein with protein kinase domain
MCKSVHLKNGTILRLQDKAFANGGEAELFKIISPKNLKEQVVKIYKPEKRTKEREEKSIFLAKNPPVIQKDIEHHSVIWINEIVYENGKFCGFTMPFAKGEKLELLCHPNLPKTLNTDWQKFDFKSHKSIELRLKLCFNIAVALYQIHKLSSYVLVDMKPDNIMVQSNGLISIIDIDSVAIVKKNKVVYPAPVSTPEYTPPEFYKGMSLTGSDFNETWDRFSLSIIFYRLLCGIHPFTGTCSKPYEKCNGLSDMVKNGLFPFGEKSTYFKVIPVFHNKFNNLEIAVQELFKRCFNEGHKNPNYRPNADEWCKILSPNKKIVHRVLPSFAFPTYNYAKAIDYNPTSKLEVPDISSLNIKMSLGLKDILRGFFEKSKKQELIENAKRLEQEIRIKEKKYATFTLELQNIIDDFNTNQKDILINEKNRIEQLNKIFNLDISYFNKNARELHTKEENEIKNLSNLYSNSISEIDKKMNLLYENIIGKSIENIEAQKTSLNKSIQQLEFKEKNEINQLKNSPTKLSKYSISSAAINNFGNSTIEALSSIGILTAADFTDVDSDGYIKNRSQKWVKAYGVGGSRVNDLKDWQKLVESKENKLIAKTIHKKYKDQILKLKNSLKNIDDVIQKQVDDKKLHFNKESISLNNEKLKLNDRYKADIKVITKRYDALNLAIIENAKIYNNANMQNLKKISDEILNNLNDNFKKYNVEFSLKMTEINSYTNTFKLEIIKLKEIQKQIH